ncbi:MAG: hypothetical protein DMG64_21055 [Acidobacteria bacterium]|nr:MAG: hypothetical protein DMG64_21055 [Acidobacteriota bacterium]
MRINHNSRDLPRVLEPEVLPCNACVGTLIDSIAGREIRSQIGLAGADVDSVRIRSCESDGANRGDALGIEDWIPSDTTVSCLPNPTTNGAEVIDVRIARNARDGDGASTTKRTDQPPMKPLIELGIELLTVYD